jgi:hypothetical protein
VIARALDGMAVDYGKMPHEILGMDLADVAFAVSVRMKARRDEQATTR